MLRAAKLIPGLYDKPYNEHLEATKVPLMYREMWGEMVLQSMNPGQEIKTLNFINHSFKLQYANKWNRFLYEVMNTLSLDCYKPKLDNTWEHEIYVVN